MTGAASMAMTPADKINVLREVVDWLEAHPDRALRHHMATEFGGFPTDPLSKKAHCFCFAGRLQNVTGLTPYIEEVSIPAWLSVFHVTQNDFIRVNDLYLDLDERVTMLRAFINDIARGFPVDA